MTSLLVSAAITRVCNAALAYHRHEAVQTLTVMGAGIGLAKGITERSRLEPSAASPIPMFDTLRYYSAGVLAGAAAGYSLPLWLPATSIATAIRWYHR